MATINMNFGMIDECINKMEILSRKIDDVSREFDMKMRLVFNTPYWSGEAISNYQKNSASIIRNLNLANETLNNYKNLLYRMSSSYSNIESGIKSNGF